MPQVAQFVAAYVSEIVYGHVFGRTRPSNAMTIDPALPNLLMELLNRPALDMPPSLAAIAGAEAPTDADSALLAACSGVRLSISAKNIILRTLVRAGCDANGIFSKLLAGVDVQRLYMMVAMDDATQHPSGEIADPMQLCLIDPETWRFTDRRVGLLRQLVRIQERIKRFVGELVAAITSNLPTCADIGVNDLLANAEVCRAFALKHARLVGGSEVLTSIVSAPPSLLPWLRLDRTSISSLKHAGIVNPLCWVEPDRHIYDALSACLRLYCNGQRPGHSRDDMHVIPPATARDVSRGPGLADGRGLRLHHPRARAAAEGCPGPHF